MRRSINGYPVRPRKVSRPEHVMLAIQQLAGTGVRFLGIKDVNSRDVSYTELTVRDVGLDRIRIIEIKH
jgi:hypothetical protein